MTPDCPICDRDDGHAPGCVIGDLQALGKEGRQTHRRALVLVMLYTHGRAMTLRELEDAARLSYFDLSWAAQELMTKGLVFAHFGNLIGRGPAVELTTAPHVQAECEHAADLLGMVLTSPPTELSPLLRRPA